MRLSNPMQGFCALVAPAPKDDATAHRRKRQQHERQRRELVGCGQQGSSRRNQGGRADGQDGSTAEKRNSTAGCTCCTNAKSRFPRFHVVSPMREHDAHTDTVGPQVA